MILYIEFSDSEIQIWSDHSGQTDRGLPLFSHSGGERQEGNFNSNPFNLNFAGQVAEMDTENVILSNFITELKSEMEYTLKHTKVITKPFV